MGKSKARIFRKGINDQIPRISRADAISETVKHLETKNINDAKNLINEVCCKVNEAYSKE